MPKTAAKTLTNADLARLLDQRAEDLGAEGANVYRIRAYRRAARSVEQFPSEVRRLLAQGADLRQIPGVGADLAGKLRSLVESGGDVAVLRERSVLPQHGETQRARKEGKRARGHMPSDARRIRPLVEALERRLRQALAEAPGITRAESAGSFRRRRDTVRDLDFLVAGPLEAARVALEDHPEVEAIVEDKGDLITARLTKGMLVDVRTAAPQVFGAAWILATGTPQHNADLVRHAETEGFQLRADGLFKGRKRVAGASEEDVFAAIGLQPIPAELREGNGEVTIAAKGNLPDLVAVADLKGDLHTHTVDSDGANTLEAMARAAHARGLSYLAVTDHTSRTAIAGGMKWPAFQRQHKLVDRLNAAFEDEGTRFQVLKGAEVDILKDGRLDLEAGQLDQLDVVVASLHFRERQGGKEHTQRALAAMGTGRAHVLGHPSGRLIGRRPPMDNAWDQLLGAAADQGWAFEVDGSPWRQDAWGELVLQGKAKGVRFALDSDAHATQELGYQAYAVEQARRGWLAKADVLNTRTAKQLLKLLA